jgi:hypothetical protein
MTWVSSTGLGHPPHRVACSVRSFGQSFRLARGPDRSRGYFVSLGCLTEVGLGARRRLGQALCLAELLGGGLVDKWAVKRLSAYFRYTVSGTREN